MRERTILLRGFSKPFAMTGFRVGYACGPAPLIARLSASRTNDDVSPGASPVTRGARRRPICPVRAPRMLTLRS